MKPRSNRPNPELKATARALRNAGYTFAAVGELLHLSPARAQQLCADPKPKEPEQDTITCAVCGREYTYIRVRSKRKYCSVRCWRRAGAKKGVIATIKASMEKYGITIQDLD